MKRKLKKGTKKLMILEKSKREVEERGGEKRKHRNGEEATRGRQDEKGECVLIFY